MRFEYLMEIKSEESIDIEDIGNCVLQGFDRLGFEYILIISTNMGKSIVIEYGPFLEDINDLPDFVKYTYNKFDFNQSKIIKTIDKFLKGSNDINQVFEISLDEAKERIRSMVDAL